MEFLETAIINFDICKDGEQQPEVLKSLTLKVKIKNYLNLERLPTKHRSYFLRGIGYTLMCENNLKDILELIEIRNFYYDVEDLIVFTNYILRNRRKSKKKTMRYKNSLLINRYLRKFSDFRMDEPGPEDEVEQN